MKPLLFLLLCGVLLYVVYLAVQRFHAQTIAQMLALHGPDGRAVAERMSTRRLVWMSVRGRWAGNHLERVGGRRGEAQICRDVVDYLEGLQADRM